MSTRLVTGRPIGAYIGNLIGAGASGASARKALWDGAAELMAKRGQNADAGISKA